jgi:hypothetical protein
MHVTPMLYPAMPHVTFRQLVNRSFGKTTIAIEGEHLEDRHLEDRQRTVRRLWAALVVDATRRYGGQDTVVVTYKSTEEFIKRNL